VTARQSRRRAPRTARRHSRGLTLLSVLVAVLIAGAGLFGMVRAVVGATATTTQNQHVSTLATLGNGFWGVVQSNPALLTAGAFAGTYRASNYADAPPALQPWLQQATSSLPAGEATIATGPDAGSAAACAVATGCTVTLTLRWNRLAAPSAGAATRAQTFYFQFGL
jgi:Tfp pilus assembly protein PilV